MTSDCRVNDVGVDEDVDVDVDVKFFVRFGTLCLCFLFFVSKINFIVIMMAFYNHCGTSSETEKLRKKRLVQTDVQIRRFLRFEKECNVCRTKLIGQSETHAK